MSNALEQFHEDRAMRDAARTVLLADIEHARVSFSAKGVADRVGGRIGDGAKDVFEVAKTQADGKSGIIAALIAMVLLWLGRDTISEVLGLVEEHVETLEETSAAQEPASEPETPSSGDADEQ